jgi:SpoVK/Ycf46/Vps4 family AAA+-type ATPase
MRKRERQSRTGERPRKRTRASLPKPPLKPKTIDELLGLAIMSEETPFRDCSELPLLIPAMAEIAALVGMDEAKRAIVGRVLAHCQRDALKPPDFCHFAIVGPPGCGKSTLAHALAQLVNLMRGNQSGAIVEGTRQNMVGQHIGHTVQHTQDVIDSARGGVLLIDEAYSLADGRDNNGDSFTKSCIDTLNRNLTETDFTCIIVGYRDSLKRDLFRGNEGLVRRFPENEWLDVGRYSARDLELIFTRRVKVQGLTLDGDASAFFNEHAKRFPNAGAVVEFLDRVKLRHSNEVFGELEKRVLRTADLAHSLAVDSDADAPPSGMYT